MPEGLGSEPEHFYKQHEKKAAIRDLKIGDVQKATDKVDQFTEATEGLNTNEVNAKYLELRGKEQEEQTSAKAAQAEYDANLWRAQQHVKENLSEYIAQAKAEAATEGKRINDKERRSTLEALMNGKNPETIEELQAASMVIIAAQSLLYRSAVQGPFLRGLDGPINSLEKVNEAHNTLAAVWQVIDGRIKDATPGLSSEDQVTNQVHRGAHDELTRLIAKSGGDSYYSEERDGVLERARQHYDAHQDKYIEQAKIEAEADGVDVNLNDNPESPQQ